MKMFLLKKSVLGLFFLSLFLLTSTTYKCDIQCCVSTYPTSETEHANHNATKKTTTLRTITSLIYKVSNKIKSGTNQIKELLNSIWFCVKLKLFRILSREEKREAQSLQGRGLTLAKKLPLVLTLIAYECYKSTCEKQSPEIQNEIKQLKRHIFSLFNISVPKRQNSQTVCKRKKQLAETMIATLKSNVKIQDISKLQYVLLSCNFKLIQLISLPILSASIRKQRGGLQAIQISSDLTIYLSTNELYKKAVEIIASQLTEDEIQFGIDFFNSSTFKTIMRRIEDVTKAAISGIPSASMMAIEKEIDHLGLQGRLMAASASAG